MTAVTVTKHWAEKYFGDVEVKHHTALILTLDVAEWSDYSLAAFILMEK
jgi:hypothetical protein